MSQTEMAILFKVSLRTYQRYESGEQPPPMALCTAISKKYNKTVDWILTGQGDLADTKAEMVREINSDFGGFAFIPQINGKINAGEGRISENAVEIKIAFRKDWIQRRGDPKNMVLMRVAGDSMEPTLLSSDLVLIDRGRNYIEPQGGIYAIALDDIIMIKRIQTLENRVRIISDNSRYEPLEVAADRIKVNGKVIWFARELER